MANALITRTTSQWPRSLVSQLLDDFYTGWPGSRTESEWMPRTDIYEKDGKYVMEVDLPGLKREQVEITCVGDMLKIAGNREEEKEVKEENFHRMERIHGSFTRQFTLPDDVNQDKIKAHMENGVLKVEIPRSKESKPKEKNISIE